MGSDRNIRGVLGCDVRFRLSRSSYPSRKYFFYSSDDIPHRICPEKCHHFVCRILQQEGMDGLEETLLRLRSLNAADWLDCPRCIGFRYRGEWDKPVKPDLQLERLVLLCLGNTVHGWCPGYSHWSCTYLLQ